MDRTGLEQLARLILMGHNDSYALGDGWYPVHEGPAGIPCRWMSPRAEVKVPGRRVTQLILTVSPPPFHDPAPGISLYYGQTFSGHTVVPCCIGEWCTVTLPLSHELPDERDTRLTLASETRDTGNVLPYSFIPHKAVSNGDLRELGMLVSTIRFA